MPTVEEDIAAFTLYFNAKGPVTYGKDAHYPTPEHVKKVFMVKSQIATVNYPKQGKPWLLGVHFCEKDHSFTNEEIESFELLGKKIGDVFDNHIF